MDYVVENEKILIHFLLKDNDNFFKFKDNFFISLVGKDMYEIFKKIYTSEKEVKKDIFAIKGNFRNSKITKKLINEIYKLKPDGDFSKYYEIQRGNYFRNELRKKLKPLNEEVEKKENFDVNKFKKMFDEGNILISKIENNDKYIITFSDMLNDYKHQSITYVQKDLYSTGCSLLDQYVDTGFRPQDMTTIFSDSGIGKTNFVLNLITKRRLLQLPTIYFNSEMSKYAITERSLQMRYDIKKGLLRDCSVDISNIINKARIDSLNEKYFYYIDLPSFTLAQAPGIIRKCLSLMRINYALVVFDVITDCEEFKRAGNNSENTSLKWERHVGDLAIMARETNTHILNVVHTNRNFENITLNCPEDIERLIPKASTIKNSGAFEKKSRLVMGLMRKKFYLEKYFPNSEENKVADNIMTVHGLKQNDGKLFTADYKFDGDKSKISQIRS